MGKETLKHEGDKDKISVTAEDFQRNSRALWSFPPETRMMKLYGHPAMFPEELPRRLIHQLSYREDVVLDPFSGAGTTCCVAKRLGRQYVGVEMSEQYHATSVLRVNNTHTLVTKIDKDGNKVTVPDWML